MRIFFNNEPSEDTFAILAFINGVASELDVGDKNISIDTHKIDTIVRGIRRDFPHKDGIREASVFKKVANFIAFFIAERPILEPFKNSNLPESVLAIENYENSIIALLIGLTALHNAEIHKNGHVVKLTAPMELSEHSFGDLVDALSNVTPSAHFKLITVLLEQLAYKTNPHCQYPPKKFL